MIHVNSKCLDIRRVKDCTRSLWNKRTEWNGYKYRFRTSCCNNGVRLAAHLKFHAGTFNLYNQILAFSVWCVPELQSITSCPIRGMCFCSAGPSAGRNCVGECKSEAAFNLVIIIKRHDKTAVRSAIQTVLRLQFYCLTRIIFKIVHYAHILNRLRRIIPQRDFCRIR